MKKKLLLMLLSLALLFSGVPCVGIEAQASAEATDIEDVDYSYLNAGDVLIGYSQSQTRGVYLLDGTSTITKISSTRIGAGGITEAAVTCKVSVAVIVEYYSGTGWARLTSWTASKASADYVSSSKTMSVTRGYTYRVRCTHYAGTDVSSSWTGGLNM